MLRKCVGITRLVIFSNTYADPVKLRVLGTREGKVSFFTGDTGCDRHAKHASWGIGHGVMGCHLLDVLSSAILDLD